MIIQIPFAYRIGVRRPRARNFSPFWNLAFAQLQIAEIEASSVELMCQVANTDDPTVGHVSPVFRQVKTPKGETRPCRVYLVDGRLFAETCSVEDLTNDAVSIGNPFDVSLYGEGLHYSLLRSDELDRVGMGKDVPDHPLTTAELPAFTRGEVAAVEDDRGAARLSILQRRASELKVLDGMVLAPVGEPRLAVVVTVPTSWPSAEQVVRSIHVRIEEAPARASAFRWATIGARGHTDFTDRLHYALDRIPQALDAAERLEEFARADGLAERAPLPFVDHLNADFLREDGSSLTVVAGKQISEIPAVLDMPEDAIAAWVNVRDTVREFRSGPTATVDALWAFETAAKGIDVQKMPLWIAGEAGREADHAVAVGRAWSTAGAAPDTPSERTVAWEIGSFRDLPHGIGDELKELFSPGEHALILVRRNMRTSDMSERSRRGWMAIAFDGAGAVLGETKWGDTIGIEDEMRATAQKHFEAKIARSLTNQAADELAEFGL